MRNADAIYRLKILAHLALCAGQDDLVKKIHSAIAQIET